MRGFEVVFSLVALAGIAAGQNVYGESAIGVWPAIGAVAGDVESYGATWTTDYTVAAYYEMIAVSALYQDYATIQIDSAEQSSSAEVWLIARPWILNRTYTLQTDHWISLYYSYIEPSTGNTAYFDPYGFSMMSPGGSSAEEIYSPTGQNVVTLVEDFYLGTTWAQDSTYVPQITGINVIGQQTPGASGYIEVYGYDLSKGFDYDSNTGSYQHSTAAISGGGIDVSVDWQDYHYPGQINLHYAIASNASTGNRTLTVTSPYGTSNGVTFTIGDRTPQISSISPDEWPVGQQTYFNVTGTGFGTAPTMTIQCGGASCQGIGSYGISQGTASDQGFQGYVNISPDAPRQDVTVVVESHGTFGQGFLPQNPQQPNSPLGQSTALVRCGDARDGLIQEYIDFMVNLSPMCSDFTQSAHSDHFSYAELTTQSGTTWAILRSVLTDPASSGRGLEYWRQLLGGAAQIVNSGYRGPYHNANMQPNPGAPQSRHMYGDAVDMRNFTKTTDEWQVKYDAFHLAGTPFVEPLSGPCKWDCVHGDWWPGHSN